MTVDSVKTLTKARKLVENPKNWIQFAMARTPNGTDVSSYHPDACQFCSVGALRKADPMYQDDDATTFLHCAARAQGYDGIISLNDRGSHENVLKMFDDAIESAKNSK